MKFMDMKMVKQEKIEIMKDKGTHLSEEIQTKFFL